MRQQLTSTGTLILSTGLGLGLIGSLLARRMNKEKEEREGGLRVASMVNTIKAYMSVLQKIMKLSRFQPKTLEISQDTTMNWWVPTKAPSPQKPALLLIHGFLGNGLIGWPFQIMSLRKNYSVYVPDLIFFGGSTTASSERSPRFQAECLAAGLRKLGVEKCLVVGLSYGGMVGFQLAEHHPELVAGMVGTGTVLALTESLNERSLKGIGFERWCDFLLPDSAEGVKTLLEIGSHTLPWLPKFFFKDCFETLFENRKEKAELLHALVMKDEDVTSRSFPQRIHLLWGEGDKIFTMEDAYALNKRLGDKSILKSLERAGHLCPIERPFAFNKCLKELLLACSQSE